MIAAFLARRQVLHGLAASSAAVVAMLWPRSSHGAKPKKAPAKASPAARTDDRAGIPGQIDLAKVPASVRAAANRVVRNATWQSAARHKDEEETYELFGLQERSRDVSVEITADGKVTSVERSIDPKKISKPAAEAIAKRMPAFKAEDALELFAGDDIRDLARAELAYQLNGTAAKGKDLTVEVTSGGKITEVKREVELADVPPALVEALAKKAPRFKPDVVHRITRDNKVAGYLFAGKRGWVAFVSKDGKEIELHKDE